MVYKSLVRNWNFLKLWGAQIASQIAANLLNFALIIRVFDLANSTPYANVAVSLLVLSFGVPAIFFAVFAGTFIDQLDRKKVLVVSNLVRALLVLLFFIGDQNLILVYGLAFAISIFTQFFVPAEAATLPLIVDKKDLMAANSLFVFTLYGSFILGYSLAGPVVAAFGQKAAYVVTALSFALAAVLSYVLPNQKRLNRIAHNLQQAFRATLIELRQNYRRILGTPELFFPILQMTIAQAMVGVIVVLAPAIALKILGINLSSASHYLIIPAGLGMVGGAIVVGQVFKRYNKIALINIGLIIAGIALIGLGLVRSFGEPYQIGWLVATIALTLGFVNALISVSAQTLLQFNSTDETRGQIFGALNMMVNVAAVAPVLLAGISADLISPLRVITGAGILILVYAFVQIMYFRALPAKKY